MRISFSFFRELCEEIFKDCGFEKGMVLDHKISYSCTVDSGAAELSLYFSKKHGFYFYVSRMYLSVYLSVFSKGLESIRCFPLRNYSDIDFFHPNSVSDCKEFVRRILNQDP